MTPRKFVLYAVLPFAVAFTVAHNAATIVHFLASYVLPALLDTLPFLGVLAVLAGLAMIPRRTRRVVHAVTRFAKRYAPKWLGPLLVVCAFIPGPLDEMFVIVAVLAVILRNKRQRATFRRYVNVAFNH